MPKKSLKQEILEEFDKLQHGTVGDFDVDVIGFDAAKLFLSSSLDKILETAKGCRPEDKIKKDGFIDVLFGGGDRVKIPAETNFDAGFNQSNAEFDNNWKDKIG